MTIFAFGLSLRFLKSFASAQLRALERHRLPLERAALALAGELDVGALGRTDQGQLADARSLAVAEPERLDDAVDPLAGDNTAAARRPAAASRPATSRPAAGAARVPAALRGGGHGERALGGRRVDVAVRIGRHDLERVCPGRETRRRVGAAAAASTEGAWGQRGWIDAALECRPGLVGREAERDARTRGRGPVRGPARDLRCGWRRVDREAPRGLVRVPGPVARLHAHRVRALWQVRHGVRSRSAAARPVARAGPGGRHAALDGGRSGGEVGRVDRPRLRAARTEGRRVRPGHREAWAWCCRS